MIHENIIAILLLMVTLVGANIGAVDNQLFGYVIVSYLGMVTGRRIEQFKERKKDGTSAYDKNPND